MALADVINRISKASAATRQAVESGASNAEARQAARQAAGVQVPVGVLAREAQADQQAQQSRARAVSANQRAQQVLSNGAIDYSEQEPSFTDNAKEDDKKRRGKIGQVEENNGVKTLGQNLVEIMNNTEGFVRPESEELTPSFDSYVSDPHSIAMPTGEDVSKLSDKERNEWQAGTALGLAGTMTAPLVATLASVGSIPAAIGLGGATALGLPLVGETGESIKESPSYQGKYDANGNARTPEESKPTDTIKPAGNGKGSSQMEEYYNWINSGLLDPSDPGYNPEAAAFAETYADLADNDLGYASLLASNNSDAWGYLLGLQGNEGIDGWRGRYQRSGVDFSNEDQALDNLMDYLYGDNAIDIYDYMTNPNSNVALANDADAIAQAARYLYSTYNYSPDYQWMQDNGLDANDIAAQAIARQITNSGWGDLDIDQVNKILEDSGDKSKLKLVDDGSEEYENSKNRQASMRSYGLPNEAYNPYEPFGLIDSDITASLMAAYNSDPGHKKRLALV